MFSESSPCLLGQHGSCSTAKRPGEHVTKQVAALDCTVHMAIHAPFQVGVEDGEVGVVLVEDVGRGALDGEVPDRVAAGLPVGRPDHFDVEPAMNFVTVSELVYRVVHQVRDYILLNLISEFYHVAYILQAEQGRDLNF